MCSKYYFSLSRFPSTVGNILADIVQIKTLLFFEVTNQFIIFLAVNLSKYGCMVEAVVVALLLPLFFFYLNLICYFFSVNFNGYM